jgi:hypothetical protein
VSIVFVIACTDEGTIERIHEQVPGAPVLAKPVYPQILAHAVAAVMWARTLSAAKKAAWAKPEPGLMSWLLPAGEFQLFHRDVNNSLATTTRISARCVVLR